MNTFVNLPAATTLGVVVAISPGSANLRLSGELDLASAGMLAGLATGLRPYATVTLDLSELSFIDSAGVDVLLQLQAAPVHSEQQVRIRFPSPLVRRVFTILGEEHRFAA
jgi:anti-anti-sigma factor